MTHRISHRIIDGRERGWQRFGRELLVGVISPMDLLNRLLSGKEWQKNETNLLAGIFQHYDYYNSTPVINGGKIPYQFAETASFGGGLLFGKQTGKNGLSGRLYANLILLGANESVCPKIQIPTT